MRTLASLSDRPGYGVTLRLDHSLIADLPLFAGIAPDVLDDILAGAHARHCTKGTVVFSQNEDAHSFFLMLHGRLRVTQVTPHGEQIVVRFVSPGDLFGVALAIGRDTYPGTATAIVDSLILAWPSAVWPELVGRYPQLANNAMRMIGSRLQEAHERLREISTEDVEHRVAHAVLKLASEAGHLSADGVLIDFPLSRQDIAEMTATTLHTVSRIMSAWEAAGIIESRRQRVTIREASRLREIAEDDGERSP
ncbi:MAG TPA: Crp/Fnr family transcriptional regulator [Pseudolabrys sp.]|nr:Crp/Fnr family transcriptional regulator [Pseudolabrys sp.]